MTLIHFDSFNYYPSSSYLQYVYTLGYYSPTISLNGRQNSYCLDLTPSDSYLQYEFQDSQDVTVGFAIKIPDITSISKLLCSFSDKSLGIQVQAYKQSGSGIIELYLNNTWKAESELALESNTYYFIEFSVHIANSGGSFSCYVNGEEWVSYTGDTQYRTTDIVNAVGFSCGGYIDDLYVATGLTMLGDCFIDKFLPIANGTYTQWDTSSGNNYETINEDTQDGDTSYNITDIDSEKDSFNFEEIESNIEIYGVKILLFSRKDDASSHVIRPFVKINSTLYYGDNINLLDSYDYYEYVWEKNPATNASWTKSEVNSAEFGYERVS